ncbi:MAG TPA: DUF3891 family protein [Steroidobacteraceae bacterium]|jgi:hypothetical protein
MIVRAESDGTLVMISQNDHASAAGFFATHWGNSHFERPQPFESNVRATYLHDLAWLYEETSPRFDSQSGRTPNYMQVPNESQIDTYRWANDWLFGIDRYAGLLASKHRTGIWKSRYGIMKQPHYPIRKLSAELEAFAAESHEQQDAVAAEFDQREIATNYNLLQVWDLLSLYICTNERLQEQTIDPVPTAYAKDAPVCMRLVPVAAGRISIDPYPFDQPSLDISVVYRRLPKCVFENEPTFKKAFFGTTPQLASFTFINPALLSH